MKLKIGDIVKITYGTEFLSSVYIVRILSISTDKSHIDKYKNNLNIKGELLSVIKSDRQRNKISYYNVYEKIEKLSNDKAMVELL